MSETLYLGIDGGGSRCRARISDSAGRVLGAAEGGHASIYRDRDGALQTIILTASEAAIAAGLAVTDLARLQAGLGLAGITTAAMARDLEAANWPFASVTLDNDAYVACLGAHDGQDGGIVIAGTGSAGLALIQGRRHAVGGWGFQIGDDGSGARIGHAAVRRAVLAGDDLIPHSALLDRILADFDHQLAAITAWAREAQAGDYARYAPLVFAQAAESDPEAMAILRAAGASLGDLLLALQRAGAPRLSLIGGLSLVILPWLPEAARQLVQPALGEPVDGAILMARRRHQHGELAPW
jgi:glucosamine kinase